MFKFLKEKLSNALKKISKKAEEEATEEVAELLVEEKKQAKKKERPKREKKVVAGANKDVKEEKITAEESFLGEKKEPEKLEKKKGFFAKIFGKKEEAEDKAEKKEEKREVVEEKAEERVEAVPEALTVKQVEAPKVEARAEETVGEEKGFFARLKEKVVTKKISKEKFVELFQELEIVLLENNVAFEVVEKIKHDLEEKIADKPIRRGKVEEEIRKTLRESIESLFAVEPIDLIQRIKEKNEKPFVILFVGQNGSGKTTSIAKVTHLLKSQGRSVILAAADTFRAASIEQLKDWGKKLGVKVISHEYGSDPGAVCWDTVAAAKASNIDVVLIDTAGRQHSNENLMREMEKIARVAKPDLKIFVGEAITGNDAVLQAQAFNDAVGVDGIILTKADVDEKGGAMISIEHVIRKPIIYLGCGQGLGDLKEFGPRLILQQLGL